MIRPRALILIIGAVTGMATAALGLAAGRASAAFEGTAAGLIAGAAIGAAGSRLAAGFAIRAAIPPPSGGPEPPSPQPSWTPKPEGMSSARPGPIRGELAELYGSVSAIAGCARALDDSSRRMTDGAADQADTVARTTQTVEALSDRIDRISQNAEDAAGATEGTLQQTRRGLEQIRGIVDGMDRLRSLVETSARKARRLGERSVEIGAIVKLIDEISSRTDMLALNATIESVRAGEHGRGFAVVAEEIRKLAERTAAATREIGTLVEAIQADTHESIRMLTDEESQVEEETRRVREAGAALERIGRMAEDSARLVDGISHSANDQVLAARELVAGIQRISEVARLIVGETTQIRRETHGLVARCARLASLTGDRRGRTDIEPDFEEEVAGWRASHRIETEVAP